MPRAYILKRRAEKQAETRRRIVEAAIELHGSIGPALTNFSMIAGRAGVQRHTLYAHFPDERSLFMACSGLHLDRHPMPDPEPWRAIAEPSERLRTGLSSIYGWYERNAGLLACVARDAEVHALTREISELRVGPHMRFYRQVLGDTISATRRPMLDVMLSFFTWRTLVRDSGLTSDQAASAAVETLYPAV